MLSFQLRFVKVRNKTLAPAHTKELTNKGHNVQIVIRSIIRLKEVDFPKRWAKMLHSYINRLRSTFTTF